jgi:hypothetical protein
MNFIQELQEARLTRNSNNQRELTYTDCKERAYLLMLMLQTMRQYRQYRGAAASYAQRTVMYRDYTRFRIDSTDLYNFFYFITGDKDALSKLKNPGAAEKERRTTIISQGNLNGLLRRMGSNDSPSKQDTVDLKRLEDDLGIRNGDYKTLRRRLSTFSTDTQSERKTTVTRLIFAARAKLSDSDFMPLFSKFALDKNLEDFDATNPEPTISSPDIKSDFDAVNYRFLLNPRAIPYVARFLEIASKGGSIPSTYVSTYFPIIKMVHDIVKAGPVYVEQLKMVHSRAKNSRK